MKFSITRCQKLFQSLNAQHVLCVRSLSSSGEPFSKLAEICNSGRLPDKFNFATDVFDVHTAQTPCDVALWMENGTQSRTWTFTQLRTESIRAAISFKNSLESINCTDLKNATILVILPKVPEYWLIYLASIRLGTIFCPATTMLSPEDIAFRITTSQAKIIITNEANIGKVEQATQKLKKFPTPIKIFVPEKKGSEISRSGWILYDEFTQSVDDIEILGFKNKRTNSDDLSQIFFTSGTTGKPKMVAHTHTSYGAGHFTTCSVFSLKKSDVYWCLSDPGWAKSSYGCFFSPWIVGATIYINQMERFEPKEVMKILCSRPITGFCAAATFYRAMVPETDESLFKFKSLRLSVAAGEAINSEVVNTWKDKTGMNIINVYGQTETTALTQYKPGEVGKPDCMGRSFGGFDIHIVDDNGVEVPKGTEGNIAIKIKPNRPIGLFKGYIKSEESGQFEIDEYHKSIVGDFYLTGDLAYMDEDGDIFYVGRSDDIIISAGYRIGPFEVESVLQTHPAVAENAVIASPDSLRGEVVKAYIILSEQYRNANHIDLIENIQSYFKSIAAPYKYPRKIEFVDALPKTISGKILRRELRQLELLKWSR